ncbi:MAG TPA: FAD-dependent oxidoreductase [Xanthomonadaceae bacterium]|nr:FAD-dependent oxidoreductase [Xanthomonadaceae bacterium]
MSAVPAADRDVLILGGGLAGLTLALQLRGRDPGLRVTVLERRAHPVAEAAFKVGESTVEIGAHYFAEVLGLRAHLDQDHVRKFGFRFFFSDGEADIARCTELGVSRLLPTPSWQIDRGRFENFLGERARALGIEFLDGASVRAIALGEGEDAHRVEFTRGDATHALSARWLVDASGRAGLLKRKLGLAETNDHDVNAVWWRVDGIIDPHAWSADGDWLARCTPPDRWRSTNHLCGPGYWAWMIPLASQTHSIGIVADGATHPLATLDTHEKAMAWLRAHQPALAAALDDPRHRLLDFHFLRHFSHGCRELFSARRWAITGEAGLFLDPFYSPGSDFIAISNDYIAELVARDRAGRDFAAHADIYQQLLRSFYDAMMTLYRGQYALFGDARVMPVKVIWDYTFYWALLAPLYYAGKLTDIGLLGRLRPQFADAAALNAAMQALLREWGARNAGPLTPDGRLLDQYRIDWFHEMNRALGDKLDDAALYARLCANVARMRWLAAEILERARAAHPALADHGLDALLAGQATQASLSAAWYAEAVA